MHVIVRVPWKTHETQKKEINYSQPPRVVEREPYFSRKDIFSLLFFSHCLTFSFSASPLLSPCLLHSVLSTCCLPLFAWLLSRISSHQGFLMSSQDETLCNISDRVLLARGVSVFKVPNFKFLAINLAQLLPSHPALLITHFLSACRDIHFLFLFLVACVSY